MDAGIYIHFPFCLQKCRYCGFYSIPVDETLISEYVDCILREIEIQAVSAQLLTIQTIYFGGGTPSLMNPTNIKAILKKIRRHFNVSENPEITLEANPATITSQKAKELSKLPVNRISLGFQSCDDEILKYLGRPHCSEDSFQTYRILRDAGFSNISIDLICAIPGQTMEQWHDTLSRVISLKPNHFSIYCFTFDEGTIFSMLHKEGKISPIDEETELNMYIGSIELLAAHGYTQYEISNFAIPGFESKHNRIYWKNKEYVGLGPSAYSYVGGKRYCAAPAVNDYVRMVKNQQELYCNAEVLSPEKSLRETAALNLRLIKEGIFLPELQERFGNLDVKGILQETLDMLTKNGFLSNSSPDQYYLTRKGILFYDTVASHIV